MAWRELIQNNFRWKLAAFAMATLVWLAVDQGDRTAQLLGQADATRHFDDLPIRLLREPASGVRYQLRPEKCSVELRGKRNLVDGLTAHELRVYIDQFQGSLGTVRVDLPDGVSLIEISPTEVHLEALPDPKW